MAYGLYIKRDSCRKYKETLKINSAYRYVNDMLEMYKSLVGKGYVERSELANSFQSIQG